MKVRKIGKHRFRYRLIDQVRRAIARRVRAFFIDGDVDGIEFGVVKPFSIAIAPSPAMAACLATMREQVLGWGIQPVAIDFAEGDYVTRGGDDVHRVENMHDGYTADFVCVRAPASGWCQVGDVEHNLCRRYSRVEWPTHAIEIEIEGL